jgi:hypothetical protein
VSRWIIVTTAAVVVLIAALVYFDFKPSSPHPNPHARRRVPPPAVASVRQCVYSDSSISQLERFSRLVQRKLSCAELFNIAMSTWSRWSQPVFLKPLPADEQWVRWIHAQPGRQLVLAQSLIPQQAEGKNWLRLGSEGKYSHWARSLARNLVTAGLGHIIIRLAPEANGTWEPYALPGSVTGRHEWVRFFQRTVAAMRAVHGAAFSFDWDVNALYEEVPLADFYPGDRYVDTIGIDAYEETPTSGWWRKLSTGPDGLDDVAAFAKAHGKPLAVGEWAATPGPAAVTHQYIAGMASLLRRTHAAYESYFFAHQWTQGLASDSNALRTFRHEFSG